MAGEETGNAGLRGGYVDGRSHCSLQGTKAHDAAQRPCCQTAHPQAARGSIGWIKVIAGQGEGKVHDRDRV
ncbi:hypothetical protein MPLSOD_140543 [Mesorhizobium sp. SOD10]|nr:hypothetical protein MPLSOD_140543 [Mesorhizobium sp. SOD10]